MKKTKKQKIELHKKHIENLLKKIEYHKRQIRKLTTDTTKYQLLLKSEKWKEKRQKVFEEQGKKCAKCGKTTSLCIHHKYYIENRLPWDYQNDAFMVLCNDCHNKEHNLIDEKEINLL